MSSAPALVSACCSFGHILARRFSAVISSMRPAVSGSETNMTRLILTTSDSGAGALMRAGAAVSGLEGPFTEDMHDDPDRHARYKSSKLALTALGEAVLAQTEDCSRHNRVYRWWGGTELTSDRLWRWDPADCILIAP
jgi:hypothetical protein